MRKLLLLAMVVLGLLLSGCESNESAYNELKKAWEKNSKPFDIPGYKDGVRECALEIQKGWVWQIDRYDYSYIRGSVKNVGIRPVRYFEVHALYTDNAGNVLDTAFTNSGEMLQPGWSKTFEIMHKERPEYKKASIRLENVRFGQ